MAFGASNAPNVAFGASDATNATLGRFGQRRSGQNRRHRLRDHLHHHGLTPAADKGFHGWHKDVRETADCPICRGQCEQVVLTPYKAETNRPLTDAQQQANTVLSALRCAVEGGFAALKTWRILDKLRLHPRHATTLIRALLVLTQHEQNIRDTAPPTTA